MAGTPRIVADPQAPDAAGAEAETVAIRMYRGILGDCFLLTHRIGDRCFRALIDCGALQAIGASGSKPATVGSLTHLGDVVQNLLDDSGGVLDLVVATHEHFDHLSGFIKQFGLWSQFRIDAVWFAWTENYADSLANDIRLNRSKGLAALSALVQGAQAGQAFGLSADALAETVTQVQDLLQFYGEIEPLATFGQALTGSTDAAAAANPRPTGRPPAVPPRSCLDVLDWLKTRPAPGKVRYLDPGEQVRFGLDDRLLATVFGPPRMRNRLLQLDPTEGAGREVYLTQPGDVGALATTLALRSGGEAAAAVPVGSHPFADRFRRWEPEGSNDPIAKLYYNKDPRNAARRIDGEWLGAAGTLALKIDGDVNNTSLALAIEVPGRDVLLFPGDAQVGNWLSWHDQKYPAKPDKPETVQETAEQILARVVFYKVGHHASHNATARDKGLEMMLSPDLVAMIPVVEAVAKEQKTKNNPDGWAMPYGDLYKRLKEKTRERIVRGDGDPAGEAKAFAVAGGRFGLAYHGSDQPLWAEVTLTITGSRT